MMIKVSDSFIRPTGTTQYTAGDAVSEVTTDDYLTFNKVGSSTDRLIEIKSARLRSSANAATKPTMDLLLFHTAPTKTADNSACGVTDADMANFVASIPFPQASFKSGNAASGADGNAVCHAVNLGIIFNLPPGNNSLYGQLVERGTYTPVDSEVFTVELDIDRRYS